MKESKIFPKTEMKSLESRLKGSKKDTTGIFSARVKPKIIEMFEVWLPQKRQLEKIIKSKIKCKNCGHNIRRVPDLSDKKVFVHESTHCNDMVCRVSIKANKKIRQKPRHTEPVKYVQCGCSNPEEKVM